MADVNDTIINEQFLDEIDNEYILKTVSTNEILADMNLNEIDAALTKTIILGIEEEAAKAIKENICVSLPNMGNVQRSYFKDLMQKHNKELQLARATMTKEEYKTYVKEVYRNLRNEAKTTYNKRKVFERFKRGRVKDFDKLVLKRGKHWANLYVQALLWLTPVEYNQDVQDQYDKINGRYID